MALPSPAERPWPQLDRLLDLLADRLPVGAVGVVERRRADHVLAQAGLPHDGLSLSDYVEERQHQLAWLLVALLARDEAQEEAIRDGLASWKAGLPQRPTRGAERTSPEPEPETSPSPPIAGRGNWWVLLAAVVLATIAWLLWPGSQEPDDRPSSSTATSTGIVVEQPEAGSTTAHILGTSPVALAATEGSTGGGVAESTASMALVEDSGGGTGTSGGLDGTLMGPEPTEDTGTPEMMEIPSLVTPVVPVRLIEPELEAPNLSELMLEGPVPDLTVVDVPHDNPWWPLGAGLFSLVVFGGLLLRMRGQPLEPPFPPLPTIHPGQPPSDPPATAVDVPRTRRLLDRHHEDTLVWGIGQHLSELHTERLDVERTVEATVASGGLPELCFERAREFRGVWLWVDLAPGGADRVLIDRLADELQQALEAADLPVNRADFFSLPSELWRPDGRTWLPQEADDRARRARVAVLTDGRAVLRGFGAGGVREDRLDNALTGLTAWEHLAFVSVGTEYDRLADVLRHWGLPCVRPVDTVAHLVAATRREGRQAHGRDFARWQVACMVAPDELSEGDALELRSVLGLDVEGFELATLWRTADPGAHRLGWSAPKRAQRLGWYREAFVPAWTIEAVKRDAVLGPVLEHWVERCGERGQRVEAEVARLWTAPVRATEMLYALFEDPAHRGRIETLLADYTAPDLRGDGMSVVLPWALRDQPGHVQLWLAKMGFARLAAETPSDQLRWPGRAGVGLGLSLGTALAGLGMAGVVVAQDVARPEIEWVDGELPRVEGRCWPLGLEHGEDHECQVAGPSWVKRVRASSGQRVEVRWEAKGRACEEVRGRMWDVRVVRCDSGGGVPASSWRDELLSQVHLRTDADDPRARWLAQALLDGGTADAVVIGRKPDVLARTLGQVPEVPRWQRLVLGLDGLDDMRPYDEVTLVAQAESWQVLEDALRTGDALEAAARWIELLNPKHGDLVAIRLRGLGLGKEDTTVSETGASSTGYGGAGSEGSWSSTGDDGGATGDRGTVEHPRPPCRHGMVYIPGGSFLGGGRRRNIEGFCMDVTEVTVNAYRNCVRGRGKCTDPDTHANCNWGQDGRGHHPINCIGWSQAKTYCRKMGKRLPSEWQWEWAARGRENGWIYPWGNGAPSCERVVMDDGASGCRERGTSPVRSKPRGDSRDGLKDMAGSVWEWVASSRDFGHVQRGGSWRDTDHNSFRTNYRAFSDEPLSRVSYVGFRCAKPAILE